MESEPLFAKKRRSGWVVISIALAAIGSGIALTYAVIAIMPALLVMFFFSSASDLAKVQQPDPLVIAHKDKISAAVQNLHPNPEWTQLASEVRLPRACSFMSGTTDCVMYEGEWDTHTPYHDGMTKEVASALGDVVEGEYVGTQDMPGSTVSPLPEKIKVGGVKFIVSVGDSGTGTNAVVKVTSSKPSVLPEVEPSKGSDSVTPSPSRG